MNTLDSTIEIIKDEISIEETIIKDTEYFVVPNNAMVTIKQVTLSTTDILNTEKDSKPFYKSFPSSLSGLNEIPNISNSQDYLLSPSPFPINNNDYAINIGLSLISKTSKPLAQLAKLQFHCQPTLNSDGLPQLNIFVFYDDSQSSEPSTKFYWDNIFEIYFPTGSVSGVTLSNIETVQVFQTNADPRTSRGTVTTVKPTSN